MPPRRIDKNGVEIPTLKESRFIDAVVSPQVKTQTEAAIIAGYSHSTAKQIATENLSKPYLAQKVDERLKELKHISKMSDDDIILYYNEQAMFSLEDCLNNQGQFDYKIAKENGALKHIKKINFTPTKEGRDRVSIELYSSKDAVDALTGIHGLKQQDRLNEQDATKAIQLELDKFVKYCESKPELSPREILAELRENTPMNPVYAMLLSAQVEVMESEVVQ